MWHKAYGEYSIRQTVYGTPHTTYGGVDMYDGADMYGNTDTVSNGIAGTEPIWLSGLFYNIWMIRL
jgi:hypothetical protein